METDPPTEQARSLQTGFVQRERPQAVGPSYYCVLCGTRAAPLDKICTNCGCPIQLPREDDSRARPRGRQRPLPPVRGIYAFLGAALMPAGVLFYFGAAIADDLLRRNPLRDVMPMSLVFLGFLIQVAGIVCCTIWLYQAWRAVIREDEEYSPGLMIALLFVPFFNFYWIFQVVPGLSKVIHRELRILEPRRASAAGWVPGLVACIFALIPYAQPIAFFIFVAWMLIANNALQRLIRRHEQWLDEEDEDEPMQR